MNDATSFSDELALVLRCAGGSQSAWADLHYDNAASIQATIRHTLHRFNAINNLDDDTLDLYGAFLLSLMANDARKMRMFAGRSSLRTFLRVAAANFTVDQLRRQRNTLSLDHTSEDGTPTISPPDQLPVADSALVQKELGAAITRWWERLDEDEQALANAVFIEHASGEVIAHSLNISLANAYTRIHRLRKKMQAMAVKDGWSPQSFQEATSSRRAS